MMSETMQLNFTRLDQSIDCSGFDCGEELLNRFLSFRALTEMSQRLSVTTVALDDQGNVIGFYSISPAQISRDDLSSREGRGIPYTEVPGIRIGRLAVSKNYQRRGVGAVLLRPALRKCLKMSEEFGGRVVLVDAKKDITTKFYGRYGFKPIKDNPLVLVLKVSTLAKAVE